MKVFVFLISLVLFVGSFLLFGYAFSFGAPVDMILFTAGLLAIALSLIIPIHLLEKLD